MGVTAHIGPLWVQEWCFGLTGSQNVYERVDSTIHDHVRLDDPDPHLRDQSEKTVSLRRRQCTVSPGTSLFSNGRSSYPPPRIRDSYNEKVRLPVSSKLQHKLHKLHLELTGLCAVMETRYIAQYWQVPLYCKS